MSAGRPKKKADELLSAKITVALTEADFSLVYRRASLAGVPVAEYARQKLVQPDGINKSQNPADSPCN